MMQLVISFIFFSFARPILTPHELESQKKVKLFETGTATALPLLVCYLSVPLIAFHPLTLQGQECRRQIQSHIQIQSHLQIQIQIHFWGERSDTWEKFPNNPIIFLFYEGVP